MRSLTVIVSAALAAAGCGSSSKSSSTSQRTQSAARPTASGTSAQAAAPPASQGATAPSSRGAGSGTGTVAAVTSGPVHATLRGPNHDPVVKKLWPYSVTVTDASGRPVAGTVDIQFVYRGQVVGRDTPPTHRLKNGRWHDYLNFPAQSLGIPLIFQVVVHTVPGTVTLNWPVKVRS